MPVLNIDFSNVGDLVPEGYHLGIVEKVDLRQSETGEYPYLNWDIRITMGEAEGRHVFARRSLSPKALWKLLPALQALGVVPDDSNLSKDFKLNLEFDEESSVVLQPAMVGLPIGIKIVHEPAQGGGKMASVEELVPTSEFDVQDAPVQVQSNVPVSVAPSPEVTEVAGAVRPKLKIN